MNISQVRIVSSLALNEQIGILVSFRNHYLDTSTSLKTLVHSLHLELMMSEANKKTII